MLDRFDAADAAPRLHGYVDRLHDCLQVLPVSRFAVKGAVEIDDVDSLGAGAGKPTGDGNGVVVIDGDVLFAALYQTDTASVLEIDCGNDRHARYPFVERTPLILGSFATAVRSARPVALNAASMA